MFEKDKTIPSSKALSSPLAVIRQRQKEFGDVVIPDYHQCQACTGYKPAQDMAVIADSGVVKRVMDCMCKTCAAAHRRDSNDLARVICAGCREVVAAIEPCKEENGFEWVRGGFYHVAECPKCTSKPDLKESVIIEKIVFYKNRGIPYR